MCNPEPYGLSLACSRDEMWSCCATLYVLCLWVYCSQILRIVWSFSPYPLYNVFEFKLLFGPHGVAASFWVGLCDLVLVSVISMFFGKRGVNPLFNCHSVRSVHVGLRACGCRSCCDIASSRNPSILSLSWVFVILQSFHNVDPSADSSMLICEFQGYMMNRLWIRCSACFLTSLVMPRSMFSQIQDVCRGLC